MIGAIGTGIVYAPWLGGPGGDDFSIGSQLVIQIQTVLATIVWSAVGTAIAIFVAKALTGLRVTEETEREGLDLGEHGERARSEEHTSELQSLMHISYAVLCLRKTTQPVRR